MKIETYPKPLPIDSVVLTLTVEEARFLRDVMGKSTPYDIKKAMEGGFKPSKFDIMEVSHFIEKFYRNLAAANLGE